MYIPTQFTLDQQSEWVLISTCDPSPCPAPRTLLAGTKENTDCVEAFLASLGNKLYTTDAENE